MSDLGLPAVTVNTGDGFSVTSNEGTAEEVKANFEAEELKPDDEPKDPKAEAKERVSKAASELGKKGGEAAAKARAKAEKDDDADLDEEKVEPKAKPASEKKESKPETPEPRQKPESDQAKAEEEKHEEGRAKARIERLARERNEEREARRRAEAERDALKARSEAPREQAPQITDFATAEEYAEALAEHKVNLRERENESRRRQEAQTAWNADKIKAFHEKTKASPEHTQRLHPSLDVEPAFLMDPKDVKLSNIAAAELILSDYPLEVIDYIDQHEDELEAMLNGQNWPDVVRGFARINERIRLQKEAAKAPKQPEERRSSSAAPPARQIPSSVQDGDEDIDGDDVDFDRHMKHYNARDQRLRRGR